MGGGGQEFDAEGGLIRRILRQNIAAAPFKVDESPGHLELALCQHRDSPIICGASPGQAQVLTRTFPS